MVIPPKELLLRVSLESQRCLSEVGWAGGPIVLRTGLFLELCNTAPLARRPAELVGERYYYCRLRNLRSGMWDPRRPLIIVGKDCDAEERSAPAKTPLEGTDVHTLNFEGERTCHKVNTRESKNDPFCNGISDLGEAFVGCGAFYVVGRRR